MARYAGRPTTSKRKTLARIDPESLRAPNMCVEKTDLEAWYVD